MSVSETAACFRTHERKSMMLKVEAALQVLAQYGRVSVTASGRFLARRKPPEPGSAAPRFRHEAERGAWTSEGVPDACRGGLDVALHLERAVRR